MSDTACCLTADEQLALALLRGDAGALKCAEARALSDTMPLSAVARLLLLAAMSGREAAQAEFGRERIAAAWEAALLGNGALHAQEEALMRMHTIRREGGYSPARCLPSPGGEER